MSTFQPKTAVGDSRGLKLRYYKPNAGGASPKDAFEKSELKNAVKMADGRLYYPIEINGKKELVSFPRHEYDRVVIHGTGKLSRKESHRFMVMISGLTLGMREKERINFLTLTTKYDKDSFDTVEQKQKYQKQINKAFTLLKQQIERYLTAKTYEKACKKRKLTPYEKRWRSKKAVKYPNLYEKCKFKLRYVKVRTDEGAGVLHIIFRKGYNVPKIPYEWLKTQWSKLWHGSWNVSISQIPYDDAYRAGMYCIRNYMQVQPVIRMSYGHQWVYLGFRKDFIELIKKFGFKRALEIHKKNMSDAFLPTKAFTYQRKIHGYAGKDSKWHSNRYKGKPIKPKEMLEAFEWRWLKATWSSLLFERRIDSPKYTGGYWKGNPDGAGKCEVKYIFSEVRLAK